MYESISERPTHMMGRPSITCYCYIKLSPLECLKFEKTNFHDGATDEEISRVTLVDSIDYYTHEVE